MLLQILIIGLLIYFAVRLFRGLGILRRIAPGGGAGWPPRFRRGRRRPHRAATADVTSTSPTNDPSRPSRRCMRRYRKLGARAIWRRLRPSDGRRKC